MERKSDLIPINVCKRATRVVESIENYQSRIGSGLSCLEAHVVHEERQYCCLHCYTFSLVQLRQIDRVDPGNPATPITPPPFYTYTFSLLPSFSDSNFFKFKNLQARIYETCFYFWLKWKRFFFPIYSRIHFPKMKTRKVGVFSHLRRECTF